MWNKIPLLSPALKKSILKKHERFPSLVAIEITSKCNADCIMCPRVEMSRPKVHMPMEIYDKILADCHGKPLKKVNLFGFGDSLVHKDFLTYLRKARKSLPGVKLILSSNSEYLTKEITDAILSENLLNVINFDIDGATKETAEKIRKGVKYETVIENVEYFLSQKKKLGLSQPQTRMTFIDMTENHHELAAFKAKWEGKTDKLDINIYNTWLGSQEDRNVGQALNRSQAGSFQTLCDKPWKELVISSQGQAALCCLDFNYTAPIGSVLTESIQEIWTNPTMSKYRSLLKEGKYNAIAPCSKCNAYIYNSRSFWNKIFKFN